LVEMPGDDSRGDGGVMSDGETYVYSLATAVPTPFTKSTMISYSIAQPGHVSLKVYDVSGRLVRILVDEKKNVGVYNIVWNGNDENNNKIAPGIYFTEFTSREFTSVKKVILVK
jgi:flagellar hook assembly protein FlgD